MDYEDTGSELTNGEGVNETDSTCHYLDRKEMAFSEGRWREPTLKEMEPFLYDQLSDCINQKLNSFDYII